MTDRVVLWYGCNVLRHGDIIHSCVALLKAVGIDATAVGGPAYCCGTSKDANLAAAEGMAKRNVERPNRLSAAVGDGQVVTWCPSCHRHMDSFISQYNTPGFEVTHFAPLLHARRDRLAPLLAHRIERRVLLHRHVGFREVDVNPLVADLLRLVPGLAVVEDPWLAPGHMCSALAALPQVMRDVIGRTVATVAEAKADDLVTVFHSCQRLLCGLAATESFRVVNWVTLLAQSLGLAVEDGYGALKKAAFAGDAAAAVDEERLEKVGKAFFERALVPELRSKPAR